MQDRWKIDWDAFRAACYSLSLNWPVNVRLVPSLGYRGFYKVAFQNYTDAAVHLIMLNPAMGVPEANRTLWHELSHAWDAEQDCAKYGMMGRQLKGLIETQVIAYESRPGERRARRLERRARSHPLIKPAE